MADLSAERSVGEKTAARLLELLKTKGPMTTKALAEALEISVPAVRQHLQSLSDQVCDEPAKGSVGRPAAVWRLTEQGHARFPNAHGEMTLRLIESVRETLGEAALDKVVADRFEKSLAAYVHRLSVCSSLAERLAMLVQIRTEEGYMAELQPVSAGVWRLVEHHCPICVAARACQGFCRNELELFRSVLGDGVVVERDEYLLGGGNRCAYRVVAERAGDRS